MDETEGLDQRRLLEATASAAHHSRDPAVTVDMLSPRMQEQLRFVALVALCVTLVGRQFECPSA